jgi:hypothetical protein
MSKIRFVGLDVDADTIAVAVAEPDGEVRPLGIIPNRLESARKMVAKLGPANQVKACYEAGPTGYALFDQPSHLPLAPLPALPRPLVAKTSAGGENN